MTSLLLIAGAIAICAFVRILWVGCKSIRDLTDELNRDQRNSYALPSPLPPEAMPKVRVCPQWMRRVNGRDAR